MHRLEQQRLEQQDRERQERERQERERQERERLERERQAAAGQETPALVNITPLDINTLQFCSVSALYSDKCAAHDRPERKAGIHSAYQKQQGILRLIQGRVRQRL